MDWFLTQCSQLLKCRHINLKDDQSYLERYGLIRTRWLNAYLHKFVGSDDEHEGFHDHPFAWHCSLILFGSYIEMLPVGWQQRAQFSFVRFDAYHKHRVVLREGTHVWTLFWHGPRVKGWGFFKGENYVEMSASSTDTVIADGQWNNAKRKLWRKND